MPQRLAMKGQPVILPCWLSTLQLLSWDFCSAPLSGTCLFRPIRHGRLSLRGGHRVVTSLKKHPARHSFWELFWAPFGFLAFPSFPKEFRAFLKPVPLVPCQACSAQTLGTPGPAPPPMQNGSLFFSRSGRFGHLRRRLRF